MLSPTQFFAFLFLVILSFSTSYGEADLLDEFIDLFRHHNPPPEKPNGGTPHPSLVAEVAEKKLQSSSTISLENLFKSGGAAEFSEKEFYHFVVSGPKTYSWLVMFYAPWCLHCKEMRPVWNKLARDKDIIANHIRLVRVDADKYDSIRESYSADGFPTVMLFRGGKTYTYEDGARDVAGLKRFVLELTKKK